MMIIVHVDDVAHGDLCRLSQPSFKCNHSNSWSDTFTILAQAPTWGTDLRSSSWACRPCLSANIGGAGTDVASSSCCCTPPRRLSRFRSLALVTLTTKGRISDTTVPVILLETYRCDTASTFGRKLPISFTRSDVVITLFKVTSHRWKLTSIRESIPLAATFSWHSLQAMSRPRRHITGTPSHPCIGCRFFLG
ncbi:hypothetical protein PAXRUDRAFT_595786 [Paxillus rubicundulus Ve08.2h10]|uniref:Uncharacterized protein n=1 Tax=Paxillus rubicundulus Ve08.2h10 TaxID=930991 RepID=A0A0D0DLD4_9AGAM|nr:hypothetical protein PAXRUDRAFT_595786 [Paxillus rubicundulus Ve08.2h10]